MTSLTRVPLRYHGSKARMAPWIISHFPKHRYYAEPFGGGAGVLLRKERSYGEWYNDLYDDVVTFFRVLQSEQQREALAERIALTVFARREFELAFERADEPVEIAARLLIRSHMGFGSAAYLHSTGFRSVAKRSGTLPAHDWLAMPRIIRQAAERFQGVTVDSVDALDFMRRLDGPDVLFYVDPPYVLDTRSSSRYCYVHEYSDDDHLGLLDCLNGLEAMVVLSGYEHPLYEPPLRAWRKHTKSVTCNGNLGASLRTECLWLNAAAQQQSNPTLF